MEQPREEEVACQDTRCVCCPGYEGNREQTRMETRQVASGRRGWGTGDGLAAALCGFGLLRALPLWIPHIHPAIKVCDWFWSQDWTWSVR